jgi:hypothetical protein
MLLAGRGFDSIADLDGTFGKIGNWKWKTRS